MAMGTVKKLGKDPLEKKVTGISVNMEPTVEDLETMKKVHEEHQAQEVQEAQRKPRAHRQRQSRINMAFSDENIEYLRIISRVEDLSITSYINELLNKDRALRAQEVLKAKRVMRVREDGEINA